MTLATQPRLSAPPMAAKRVALVVRVSTDRQAGNPEGSLKNQLQRLRQHIAYKRDGLGEDWQEVALFELKGISGKSSLRRSELQPLLAGIRANQINVIACTALDRLCRNVRDFLELLELLNEHGVEFVCLKQNYDTTTPQGKLFITIMMALAEFEREQTSERTKDAVRARAERGLWNGGRVLGYDPDPTNKSSLVINQEEAAVVNAAFQLYLQTGSLKDTASALNERGHRTKSYTSRRGLVHPGKPFSLTAVQGLLKNRAFIAMKEIGKRNKRGVEVVPAVWPPIVPLETFDEVQQLMAANGRRRHNSAEGIKHVHVLVGLLHCGLCGTALQGRSGTGRLARRYYYYTCPSQGCGLRVVADEIEGAVLDHIGELAQTEGLLERLVEETNTRLLKQKPALLRQQKALWRNLAEVNAQAGSLLTEWSTVTADHGKSFVTEKLTELAERRAALERGVAELEQQLAKVQDKAVTAEVVRAALSQVQQVYACLKPYEQRELVRLALHRAEVHVRELVLEINSAVGQEITPATVNNGGVVRRTQDWLPGTVSQSVFRQAFRIHLRSLVAWSRRRGSNPGDLAAQWQTLLDLGFAPTRATLVRMQGVSGARVTQVLGPVAQ